MLHAAVLMLQTSGSSVWQPKSRTNMAISRLHQHQCQWCGTPFTSVSPAAKWCHVNCRVNAYRARRTQALAITDHGTDPLLPLQWQEQADPGHECRVWRGTAIQRREHDGFVNATAMCQAGGKLFADYARLSRTRDYMTALISAATPVMGIPAAASDLIHTIQGGTPSLQGTWIHPRLAVDLARWISPAFAVWMDGWFLESIQRPAAPQPKALAPALPHGVHVIASNPRHADWLWAEAVEKQVSAALMAQIAANHTRRSSRQPYQLHLIAS